MKSIYDLTQSFEENVTYGPFYEGQLPALPPVKSPGTFLGHQLNSLFGVAACPLTANARNVQLMSQLGYDLITYKSVRSVEWRGNPFPHWLHVNVSEQFTDFSSATPLTAGFDAYASTDVSMANSFGIHSIKPEYWQTDVNQALSVLTPGQLLILSLMPTPIAGQTLIDDSRQLAKLALETKAEVFEVNLACPNTDRGAGLIYDDLELSHHICVAMKEVLGNRPLLVKVGYYQDQAQIKTFLDQNKDVFAGVASTNTYARPLKTAEGQEAFPGRPSAGVSGGAIRTLSLQQSQTLVQYKNELGSSSLAIIGIGGVTAPEHIDQYLSSGVDAVQSAVGVWTNPLLASEYKNAKGTHV